MKLAPTVLAALAVILALVLVDHCARRDERHKAGLIAHDVVLDSVVRADKQRTTRDSLRWERQRDSTSRVIANLRSRIAGGRPATPQPPITSGRDSVIRGTDEAASAPLLLRDSLIAAYEAGRQQDSLQILFWHAQTVARDSVIDQLQRSRNAWRSRSERRFACVAGPAAAMSLSGRGVIGVGVACGWRF